MVVISVTSPLPYRARVGNILLPDALLIPDSEDDTEFSEKQLFVVLEVYKPSGTTLSFPLEEISAVDDDITAQRTTQRKFRLRGLRLEKGVYGIQLTVYRLESSLCTFEARTEFEMIIVDDEDVLN